MDKVISTSDQTRGQNLKNENDRKTVMKISGVETDKMKSNGLYIGVYAVSLPNLGPLKTVYSRLDTKVKIKGVGLHVDTTANFPVLFKTSAMQWHFIVLLVLILYLNFK